MIEIVRLSRYLRRRVSARVRVRGLWVCAVVAASIGGLTAVAPANVASLGPPALSRTEPPPQARELVVEQFDAEFLVRADGTLRVTERLRVRFRGSWNGLRRSIPLVGELEGHSWNLGIGAVEATDAEGRALQVDRDRQGDMLELRIWVDDASDAVRDVVIRYHADRALLFAEDPEQEGAHDELYWDVIGPEWDAPIENVAAVVVLPEETRGIAADVYTGRAGMQGSDATFRISDSAVFFRTEGTLLPGEAMTIAVGWDPGPVERPGALDSAGRVLATFWPLSLPFLAFAFMYSRWNARGRDPAVGPIPVRYEPPADLTPGEVGFMDDEALASREITATIVDLAVRGHLAIEEEERKGFLGIGSGSDYVFVRKTDQDDWDDLRPHESTVLRGLFDSGLSSRTTMDDLEGEFHKSAARARKDMQKAVVKKGYYPEVPAKVRGRYVTVAFALAFGMFWLAGMMDDGQSPAFPAVWLIAAAGTGLVVAGWGWLMPARTVRGTSTYRQTRGFREFLSRVESDRIDRTILTPDMFDRYLPYAMALGVEERWAERFEGMTLEPPEWYHGTHVGSFTPGSLVKNMGSMGTATAQAMAPPSSSGSGGSGLGGGGSAGGGVGGGGGGGF